MEIILNERAVKFLDEKEKYIWLYANLCLPLQHENPQAS